MERFVEGEPMLNYVLREDELHSKKAREELAKIGLETVMKMIFLNDFIHADLVSYRVYYLIPISISRDWLLGYCSCLVNAQKQQ